MRRLLPFRHHRSPIALLLTSCRQAGFSIDQVIRSYSSIGSEQGESRHLRTRLRGIKGESIPYVKRSLVPNSYHNPDSRVVRVIQVWLFILHESKPQRSMWQVRFHYRIVDLSRLASLHVSLNGLGFLGVISDVVPDVISGVIFSLTPLVPAVFP